MSTETRDSQPAPAPASAAPATDSAVAPPAPPRRRRQLRLTNRAAVRRSLVRVMRDFDADPLADPARFKALLHGFTVLLALDKYIDEAALEDRLAAIEARLAEHGGRIRIS